MKLSSFGALQPAFWLLGISVAVAVGVSSYKYLFTQSYSFLVEAPCNPATQECYIRDCEVDYCPPNGLDTFRVFELSASKFKQCTDNSCLNICLNGDGTCKEIICSAQEEYECSEEIPS